MIAGTTTSAPATQISAKTGVESSTAAGVYVAAVMGAAAMVAGAAIFVVRKKKKELDNANVKTPRDRATTAAGAMMLLNTPKDNITIL